MLRRDDPLYARIVETWDLLWRCAEADLQAPDDGYAWVHGGLLLFTLLRILLRAPGAEVPDAIRADVQGALADLRGRVNGTAEGASRRERADYELAFLGAFNEYLMVRHDERLRLGADGSLTLGTLGLGQRLAMAADLANDSHAVDERV